MRDLSTRLLRLHRVLLDRERRTYEDRYGAIPSRQLLHLTLHDEQFSWLRSLSMMIAHIDEIVDADEPIVPEDVQNVFRAAYRLIKSGESGDFQDKYRVALQDSPDVVMAHAEVSRVLPASVASATSP
jgi:hypothetical protein